MRRALPFAILPLLLAASGCAATAESYVDSRKSDGFRVTAGYVIRLTDLHDPVRKELKDGVSYEVTAPGCTVMLEFGNHRRRVFRLQPGDYFVQSRPFSYVLQQTAAAE